MQRLKYTFKIQTNFHYTRVIAPKPVSRGGAHLHGLARGYLHTAMKKRRSGGDTVSDLTGLGIEPTAIAPITLCVTTEPTCRYIKILEHKTV